MLPFDYTAHAFAVVIEVLAVLLLIGGGLAVDALLSRRRPTTRRLTPSRHQAQATLAAWRRAVRHGTQVIRPAA
jgi:uncharacterized membrane protein